MGFLKRIFGQGNQETDKKVEDDVRQIQVGEVDKIYPILKPGDWVGLRAGAVRQTLLGTSEDPLLVVAFGYDAPSNFVFLTDEMLEDKDPNEIVKEAYSNLEEVVQEFELGDTDYGQLLFASGHDFSSEKILCKSHMDKAHELLNSEELLVSIPRRRCMLIAPRKSDGELLKRFIAMHKDIWKDDSFGNAPIVDALFVVVKGSIDGVIPLDR
jgi:hypothetical protein